MASHREGGYIGLKGAVIKGGGEHGMVAIINITYWYSAKLLALFSCDSLAISEKSANFVPRN